MFWAKREHENIEKQVWNAKIRKDSDSFPTIFLFLKKHLSLEKDGGEDQQEATIYEYVR